MNIRNFEKIKGVNFFIVGALLYVSLANEDAEKYHIQISDYDSNTLSFELLLYKKKDFLDVKCDLLSLKNTLSTVTCSINFFLKKNDMINVDSFLFSITNEIKKNPLMISYLYLIAETQSYNKQSRKLKLQSVNNIFGTT